jgi:hypothetical protein
MDTPKWMYMDKAAQQANESSEYQTIGLRKGFNTFGAQFGGSGTESNFFVKLFTGKYRTHDPLYLILNSSIGIILVLPLLLLLGSLDFIKGFVNLVSCLFVLMGICGIALLINVILSFFSKKPKDIDDKGGIYF